MNVYKAASRIRLPSPNLGTQTIQTITNNHQVDNRLYTKAVYQKTRWSDSFFNFQRITRFSTYRGDSRSHSSTFIRRMPS